MTKKILNLISDMYQRGENIIQYLSNINKSENSDVESIMISYDFQSGNYTKNVESNPDYYNKYTKAVAKVIDGLDIDCQSILEAGVGEATTLANVIVKLKRQPDRIYGFDLSWSRIRYAIEFIRKKCVKNTSLFTGDLFNIPLANNSIDIVYTSHSIEPNGGKEKEALSELMRVTKKYLILLEPAYEFASPEGKKRMENHGYVKNLYTTALSLGLNVVERRLFDVCTNDLNPTELIVIKKDFNCDDISVDNPFICPLTKHSLELIRGSYFSKKGMLAYPIIDGVICLFEDNAVIATHYLDNFMKLDNHKS